MSGGNKALAVFLAILIFVGIAYLFSRFFMYNFTLSKTPVAVINGNPTNLLVARTDSEKEIGLSGRKSLPKNEGMIFSFGVPNYYPFWMKGMKFPIDIIYLRNKKIVTILKNVPVPTSSVGNPPLYNPTAPADTVIEINAGLSSQYNLKDGETITYENFSG